MKKKEEMKNEKEKKEKVKDCESSEVGWVCMLLGSWCGFEVAERGLTHSLTHSILLFFFFF